MEKRILGRTGLEVSVLGMGGLFVSNIGGRGRDEACKAVRRALELGVNYVDSAPTYADSEEVLGMALEGVPRDSYYISTKIGGRPQPFNPKDKDALRRSVDESLRLLKLDYLDILMIHELRFPSVLTPHRLGLRLVALLFSVGNELIRHFKYTFKADNLFLDDIRTQESRRQRFAVDGHLIPHTYETTWRDPRLKLKS